MNELRIDYTNHNNERRERHLRLLSMRWGVTEWHKAPGILILADDLERHGQGPREFSLSGFDLLPAEHLDALSTKEPPRIDGLYLCVHRDDLRWPFVGRASDYRCAAGEWCWSRAVYTPWRADSVLIWQELISIEANPEKP